MLELKKYTVSSKDEWNDFIDKSRNGTFLFNRDYMDYHSDRFQDNSFLIYNDGKLCAVLPANRVDDVLYSHQGLTYGGFIISAEITLRKMLDIFNLLNKELKDLGFLKVIYKPVPSIYHQTPAEEDLYALFKNNAKITGRNISSTIFQNSKMAFKKLRRHGINKAIKNNIIVSESEDYAKFWEILSENLKHKHRIAPVHSLDEICFLHSKFPRYIKLYMAYKEDVALGGVLVYITKKVVHTQYISANSMGKELGVLDLLFDYLINTEYTDVPVFDFGQSTEQKGQYLNEGLIFQKEGFGARAIVYDIYEYDL